MLVLFCFGLFSFPSVAIMENWPWLVEFPFEIRALEVLFEAICSFLDARTRELETAAYPALDELTSKVKSLCIRIVYVFHRFFTLVQEHSLNISSHLCIVTEKLSQHMSTYKLGQETVLFINCDINFLLIF